MRKTTLFVALVIMILTLGSIVWAADSTEAKKEKTITVVKCGDESECKEGCPELGDGKTKCIMIKCDDKEGCEKQMRIIEGDKELNLEELIKKGEAFKIENGKETKILILKGATQEEREKILQEYGVKPNDSK